jgi:hypothetical protein
VELVHHRLEVGPRGQQDEVILPEELPGLHCSTIQGNCGNSNFDTFEIAFIKILSVVSVMYSWPRKVLFCEILRLPMRTANDASS